MQLKNDSNIEKFGSILYRLQGSGVLQGGSGSGSGSGSGGSSSSGSGSSGASEASSSSSTVTSNADNMHAVAKHLVAHGYELYLLKCQFGGSTLAVDGRLHL